MPARDIATSWVAGLLLREERRIFHGQISVRIPIRQRTVSGPHATRVAVCKRPDLIDPAGCEWWP